MLMKRIWFSKQLPISTQRWEMMKAYVSNFHLRCLPDTMILANLKLKKPLTCVHITFQKLWCSFSNLIVSAREMIKALNCSQAISLRSLTNPSITLKSLEKRRLRKQMQEPPNNLQQIKGAVQFSIALKRKTGLQWNLDQHKDQWWWVNIQEKLHRSTTINKCNKLDKV